LGLPKLGKGGEPVIGSANHARKRHGQDGFEVVAQVAIIASRIVQSSEMIHHIAASGFVHYSF
jgi:hypothetical protein